MVTPNTDTIAAIATGGIVSAIGIVRVSGPASIGLMDALFRPADGKPMSAHADRTLVYGSLLDREGEVLDICLCTVSRAPNSYTGENTAELQCHGSPVVLRAALDSLLTFVGAQVMTEKETGIALSGESWTTGTLALSAEDEAALAAQADAFLEFIA